MTLKKRTARATQDEAASSTTGMSRLLAEAVSAAFSPPLVAALWLWFALDRVGEAHPRIHTSLFILLAVGAPALYVVWLLRRGQVTDLDVSRREQRKRPMLVMAACSGVAWLLLWIMGGSDATLILTGALTLQSALMLAVTLHWKISQHGAMSAWAGRLGWLLLGTPLALLVVPLVVWSRVRLGRHTLAEAVAGALLGLAISSAAMWLARITLAT